MGLALEAASAPASAITSSVSFLPSEELARLARHDRLRRNRAQHQARLEDGAVGRGARRRGHPEQREIEGTAPAQLPVGAAPSLGFGQHDLGQDLVRLARDVVDAIVVVQARQLEFALARRRHQAHLRAQRDQGRRGIGRGHGEAALARGRDPAGRAFLLHAVTDRLAPFLVLVVVVAARVQAQIAAQRAHVAQMRRGHLRRRLVQAAVFFAHGGAFPRPR